MSETKKPRRRADERQIALSLRVAPETRARLIADAERKGHSLTQEAGSRLEQSFRDDDVVIEVLSRAYGPEIAGILLLLAATLRNVGPMAGFNWGGPRGYYDWFNLPQAYNQAANAVNVAVEAIRPDGDIDRLKSAFPAFSSETADNFEVPVDRIGAAAMLVNLRGVVDPANAPRNIRDALAEVGGLLGRRLPIASHKILPRCFNGRAYPQPRGRVVGTALAGQRESPHRNIPRQQARCGKGAAPAHGRCRSWHCAPRRPPA